MRLTLVFLIVHEGLAPPRSVGYDAPMDIQWFPGHMLKTQRLIQEHRSQVDVFLEVVDARAPIATSNPLLDELLGEAAIMASAGLASEAGLRGLAETLASFDRGEAGRAAVLPR